MKKQFQSKSVPRGTRTIWRYLSALILLFSLGIGQMWAAQETVTKVSNDKDEWNGTCATIDDDVMTSSNSGSYVKMRTGNNSNRITINVKSGYKITGLSIQAYSNNSIESATISMTSVSYDGGTNVLSENVVFPTSGNKPTSPNYTNSTNEATSSIVMTFDNSNINSTSGSKNKQIMAIMTLTYETISSGPVDPTATFSNSDYIIGGTLDLSTLYTTNSEGAVTYSITDAGETGATLDTDGKTFSATATGSVTVKATQAATSAHNSVEKTATITVKAAPATPDVVLNDNGTLNSTDFVTLVTSLDETDYTVESTAFDNNFKFGNTASSFANQSWSNKYLAYDVKTTSATLKLYVYNKNNSSKYLYYQVLSETGNGDMQTETITSKGDGKIIEIPVTATKGTRVVFGVNSSDVRICQLEVFETGTALPLAAQVGYEVAMKGRPFATGSSNLFSGSIDGMEYVLYSELKLVNGNEYSVLRSNTGSHYFKFSAANDVQLQVTTTNASKFFVLGSATAGDENDRQYGGSASVHNINLPHKTGDWYIIPVVNATGTGNEVRISKIAFATLPAGLSVTYNVGDGGSVKEGKSLPTHADAYEGDKIILASGENLEKSGYDFIGWKANGTGDLLEEGDEYTMGNATVEFVAQWTLHVAKYGVKFMDGATKLDSLSVTLGEAPVFADPTKALYSFAGWKDGEDNDVTLSDLATSVTVEDTKLVLYAQWTKLYAQSVDFTEFLQADERLNKSLAQVFTENSLNYVCGGTFSNSEWGKTNGEDAQYQGYKFKDKNVYVEFRVEANKRVTLLFGSYNAIGTIKVGDAEAVDCSLTDSKYVIDTDAEQLIRFTTNKNSGSTVTLKSITVGEIPALSDDATLSDLKVGGITISGFSSSVTSYYVEMPYGTAKADLPLVTVTTNEEHAVATVQDAKDRPDDTRATIHVVAQNGTSDKYYYVYFTIAPKYGVELIKATHNGTANGATVTGYIGGTVDKLTQNNGKLGSGAQSGDDPHHYFGIQLAEGTFKAGDMLVIKASALNGGNAATLYSDKGNTEINIDGQFDTNSKMYVYTLEADVEKIYLYRQTSGCNPNVEYMAVYRLMAPFIEEFKIGEAVGTINGTNIAVEVPYAADLEHLTPAVKYWANGTAQISPAIGVTDFTDPVVFTVSSGYAEDATGAYAPVPYTVTVTKEAHYEAKIGETGYATLVAAVAAAQDGDEIVLQEDVTNGAGVMLTKTDAKVITIDFGGYTYTAVSPAVGSAGTQNQAFHLEKGNTVTLKNGTITSSGSEIKMLIQNYCDLTLENITLDGSGLEGSHRYVMSNNCGDVVIGNGTTITAKEGDVAFDVCATNYYPDGVTVTVKNGASITGIVEYDVWGTKPADNKAELAIEGGNFNITWNVEEALAEDAKENLNVSGGTFTAAVPADYCAEGYAPTSWTVGTETKYGVHLLGVIRAAAAQDANHGNANAVTLDNGVVVISSNSDGKFDTNNQFDNGAADAAVALGADEGKYRYKGQHMLLKFPVNVNEFTIYSYDNNTTDRKINKVTVGTTPATEKLKNNDAIGTYTFTNNTTTKLRTMTATMTDDEIIASDKYVYVGLSNAHTVFRILFTEAPCVDPVINSTNATRVKVSETATVSVDATALGATYQWYRCSNAAGDNAVIIPGATAASYSFTKAAGDEYFKVVVGNNCNDVKVEAVVKAEVWTKLELADVTGNTTWSWAGVADGEVKINDVANKGLVLANYIDAPNFDKLEGHENARAYRSNDYPAYQGTSLKFHTTVAGAVIMDVRTGSGSFDLSVNGTVVGEITATRSIQAMYVGAGDVLISATDGEFRIYNMEFKLDNDLEPARTDDWLAPGELGTICIPQGAVAVGADIYELVGKEPQYGKIVFESVEHMKPGKPYLFQAKGTRIDFILTDETPASEPDNENSAMKGTFVDLNLTELDNVYYFADHALWSCDDLTSLSVPANRAYVKMDEVQALQNPNAAPGRRRVVLGVHGEQVVTGVENLNASEQPIKLLINGQIFILRGEKLFDATGRLVK